MATNDTDWDTVAPFPPFPPATPPGPFEYFKVEYTGLYVGAFIGVVIVGMATYVLVHCMVENGYVLGRVACWKLWICKKNWQQRVKKSAQAKDVACAEDMDNDSEAEAEEIESRVRAAQKSKSRSSSSENI